METVKNIFGDIANLILGLISIIAVPLLAVALPLVCMGIGGSLLMMPGLLAGSLLFDDIPTWYAIIFMVLPCSIGMYVGVNLLSSIFDGIHSKIDKWIK